MEKSISSARSSRLNEPRVGSMMRGQSMDHMSSHSALSTTHQPKIGVLRMAKQLTSSSVLLPAQQPLDRHRRLLVVSLFPGSYSLPRAPVNPRLSEGLVEGRLDLVESDKGLISEAGYNLTD